MKLKPTLAASLFAIIAALSLDASAASDNNGAMKSGANTALIVFLVIAAFFLIAEHRAHLAVWFAYRPYLLLLACPLMHLFMHGGHRHHGGHGSSEASKDSTRENK